MFIFLEWRVFSIASVSRFAFGLDWAGMVFV